MVHGPDIDLQSRRSDRTDRGPFPHSRAGDTRGEDEEAPEKGLDVRELTRALRSLEDDCRELVIARIWGNLSFQELAEMAGCSTSSAHRRYEAGLRRLRESLRGKCLTESNSTKS